MWLHGATKIEEANELERWLVDRPPLSEMATENAAKCINWWKNWLKRENAHYAGFKKFKFEKPLKEESLIQYLQRIAIMMEKEGPFARLEWRAFKSFLIFLRKLPLEAKGFIEEIFPQKMDIQHGRIVRRVPPEIHSIPQGVAAEVLKELARRCRFDRRNAQLTAAESLGLCWMCLSASRLRLPIHLEALFSINPEALQLDEEFPILLVPAFFGDRRIRISRRVAKFLHLLSRIPSKKPRETILQSPLRSLTRTFEVALKDISPNPEFGNITYVSLLSPPHHCGAHRYQPK